MTQTPNDALRELWEHTNNRPRQPCHRLGLVFRTMGRVLEQGPDAQHISDLNADKAVTGLGLAGVLRLLAELLEEGQP